MSIIPFLKEMPVVTVEQIVRFRAEVFRHVALLELEVERLDEERFALANQLVHLANKD